MGEDSGMLHFGLVFCPIVAYFAGVRSRPSRCLALDQLSRARSVRRAVPSGRRTVSRKPIWLRRACRRRHPVLCVKDRAAASPNASGLGRPHRRYVCVQVLADREDFRMPFQRFVARVDVQCAEAPSEGLMLFSVISWSRKKITRFRETRVSPRRAAARRYLRPDRSL